jgi:2-polyprenyl-6-methoxyphenol hydroxylase-like FAD-dependent oxidoreductase
VVLGGSIAGLTAAATLAPRFEQVTIVERDALPTAAATRRGVPQGRHGHALLPAGLLTLEALLPEFADDLVAAGAHVVRDAGCLRLHLDGGFLVTVALPERVTAASRPLIEAAVRRRVLALPNVDVIQGCDARGVVTDAARTRVTGARLLPRRNGASEEVIHADLVVDATGRGSRSPAWLAALGYDAPEEEQVEVDIHYTTRLFRRDGTDLDGARQILVGAIPTGRGAFMQTVEDDCWLVSLVGYFGDRPPADLEGFRAFAASLETPEAFEIATSCSPVGDGAITAHRASRRRRYERLRRFPDRYVVIGDAVCSFNPTFGQGMSVAALEADLLGRVVDRGLDGVGRRFFRRARRLVDVPWRLAVGEDLRFPHVAGHRDLQMRLVGGYIRRLVRVAHRDPDVALAFLKVLALLVPPESLMAPRVVRRVLRSGPPPRRPPARRPPTRQRDLPTHAAAA